MEASEEAVVLALDVLGFPATSVAVVEVEAVVLDWVVQVAPALEAATVEVLEEAQKEVVASAEVMVLVVAPAATEQGATATGSAVASTSNEVDSSPSRGKPLFL